MDRYLVTWADGVALTVTAETGTEAKAIARAQRGVKKSECRIASVGAVPAPEPAPTNDISEKAEAQS
jgi:hypothetical protein